MEVLEIYRAIKARGDTGHSAGAVINLIWENQLDGKKLKPVSNKVIQIVKADKIEFAIKKRNLVLEGLVLEFFKQKLMKIFSYCCAYSVVK